MALGKEEYPIFKSTTSVDEYLQCPLYIDLFAEKYEILSIFIFEIKNCSLLYSCECNIICQNIYSCNNVEQLSHSSMLI